MTDTASAATDISDQNARFVRRKYNAKAVGAVAVTPNAKMNSSASPNACMPEDASRSGPLVRITCAVTAMSASAKAATYPPMTAPVFANRERLFRRAITVALIISAV